MEVEIIKANDPSNNGIKTRRIERLRVAAYCRVSTDDEDQIKSYNSMVQYYTDLIKNNKQWMYVGVYADKAITGTKTDKTAEFQRLIQDCMEGKIDMVIAKSIPRFARNTLDTLKYVRMLKEKNIAVYFEVEKINTLKDGEFLITILSSVAQQEVENTSAYVKKGLKMKMKRGELVGFQGCLGYDYDPLTKELSINEEGAKTVRYIFERYVSGAGSTMIARELNEQGIPTIKGNPWRSSSVMRIINNEKYKGDVLLGKTFTVDPISKRRIDNLGEEDRYYVRNHHEPIISEEMFEKAQEIRKKRNGGKVLATPGKREKYSRQYAFSSMLECGFCGSNLSRRRWHSNSKYKTTIWQCIRATKDGKRFCPDSKGIPEETIEKAFIESYRMLSTDNQDILEEFLGRIEKTLNRSTVKEQARKIQNKIDYIQARRKKLLDNFLQGIVVQDIYEETDLGYQRQLANLEESYKVLEQELRKEKSLSARIKEFKKELLNNQILEEFDRAVFESLIEKVIIGGYDEDGNKDPYKITFIYKTGFRNDITNAKEKFKKIRGNNLSEKAQKLCSDITHEVEELCFNDNIDARGKRLFAIEETLSLCGLTGFFEEYEPVFLAGKNVYRIKKFKRGAKIC
ncbi:MAG: recombinase family protein [Eubacterium sp.]|nr:recombinase family protein [Eubacterium sp.]